MADDYEPGDLETAWAEFRDANPRQNTPDGWIVFRAGYRRGIAQGALLAASTIVHGVARG